MATNDLSTYELAVCAALERLGDEHQRSAERADGREERAFFRRWAGAFRKALYFYSQGVRPEPTPSGVWLIPSATRASLVHQVGKENKCSCEARDRGCWHAALALGVEVATDDLDRFDGGDPEPPDGEEEDISIQYNDAPAGSHESYVAIIERRRAAGLDVCGGRMRGHRLALARRAVW